MSMTSDTRCEVAEELRDLVSEHSAVQCDAVAHVLGLKYEVHGCIAAFSREDVTALADFIDPTCEMDDAGDVPASVKDNLNTFFCSECGAPIYNDMTPSYCPYCGYRVTVVR